MSRTGRGQKQAFSVAVDTVLCIFSLWLAHSLRQGEIFTDFANTWYFFLLVPLVTVLLFTSLGIYRWVVRSSNRSLFQQLIKASIASAIFLFMLAFLFPPDRVNPRSLFAIYGMLLIIGTCGTRSIWQGMFDSGKTGEPVAVYGAGSAGRELIQYLHTSNDFRPVAFIDDNQNIVNSLMSGIPIMHAGMDDLPQQLLRLDITKVIFAMPTIGATEYQQKLSLFEHTDISVLTVPTITEIISGEATVGEVRDVSINDLLGRSEVPPDLTLIGRCVRNKVVMVTGGGGSIGSEICRQILLLEPEKLIILDNSEPNLYHITEEMRLACSKHGFTSTVFIPILGSVTDQSRVETILDEHQVHTIYHAAAYKHVPIVEAQPEEGVRVNVFGTLSVLEQAIERGVSNFVLISTDKAVRPTNSMGGSKRTAELILQAKSREQSTTTISMVRFGNVLGSSGSVVPKFKKQIKDGGPITLTHPDITRFFMTIPEAAQLVLQASSIAKGGDVFVLDMGEPVRIEDLAKSMVHLMGKKLSSETGNEADIDIVVEGLRPGEKMYEELFIDETHRPTLVPKVYVANEAWIHWAELSLMLDSLRNYSEIIDRSNLRKLLMKLAFVGQADSEQSPDSNIPMYKALDSCNSTVKDISSDILDTATTISQDSRASDKAAV